MHATSLDQLAGLTAVNAYGALKSTIILNIPLRELADNVMNILRSAKSTA